MKVTKRTIYCVDNFELTFEPMEDSIKIKKIKKGYTVKYLTRDNDTSSPDDWQDEGALLVNYHRDFYVKRNEIITEENVRNWYQGEKISQQKDYYIFMLSCLVHSGVWLSLNYGFACDSGGWDTSHVGVVLISKKEFGVKEKAYKYAEGLIADWNMYLQGDIYCAVKEEFDKEKDPIDYDIVGGFYGYEESLKRLETEI